MQVQPRPKRKLLEESGTVVNFTMSNAPKQTNQTVNAVSNENQSLQANRGF